MLDLLNDLQMLIDLEVGMSDKVESIETSSRLPLEVVDLVTSFLSE